MRTLAGPLGELRAASAAGGGTALSTTAGLISLPFGSRHLFIEGRNYSTAVVAKIALNPWLSIVKTTDALAAVANATDYSNQAQDGSTSTDVTLSSLGTAAQLDFLYVGSHLPFRGAMIDIDAANATASVITVKYRKSDNTWTDITATDGTDSAGASMGQDGNVTWTVPTDWIRARLGETQTVGNGVPYAGHELYWTRWEFSGGLDSSTTLNSMRSLNRSTAYAELVSGRVIEEEVFVGLGGVASVEALTDAGTANLIVNCAAFQSSNSSLGFV
jgi:hypothetical protein